MCVCVCMYMYITFIFMHMLPHLHNHNTFNSNVNLTTGEIDLVILQATTKFQLVKSFPKIYKGTHVSLPFVKLLREKEFHVDIPGNQQGVVLDGELVGATPASFQMFPAAISIRTI